VNYGMNYGQHRYSTLTQINKRNVRNWASRHSPWSTRA
jgi:glucose dehydrogenase